MNKPDAIVLLGGISVASDPFVDESAARIVGAFEDQSEKGPAVFLRREGTNEDYGTEPFTTRRVSVLRRDPADASNPPTDRVVADVYGLDYRPQLLGGLPDRAPILRLLSTAWVLFTNSVKLLFAWGRNSKTSTEKWQVRMALFLYAILFTYMLIVAGAVVATIVPSVSPDTETIVSGGGMTAEQAPSAEQEELADRVAAEPLAVLTRLRAWLGPLDGVLQTMVVWVTAIGMFFRKDVKTWIESTGVEIIAANNYLTYDRHRREIRDQFSALLNHIEQKELAYAEVKVVAYSFGSIIAIDSLFSPEPPGPRFKRVRALATIGCPFDFVRTYWPDRFANRTNEFAPRWINIHAPADILSSDFQDEPKKGEPAIPTGVEIEGQTGSPLRPENFRYGEDKRLEQYGRFERWGLVGFHNHKRYWDSSGFGCFAEIVRELYRDSWALQ